METGAIIFLIIIIVIFTLIFLLAGCGGDVPAFTVLLLLLAVIVLTFYVACIACVGLWIGFCHSPILGCILLIIAIFLALIALAAIYFPAVFIFGVYDKKREED